MNAIEKIKLVPVTLVAWQSRCWASRETRRSGAEHRAPLVTVASGKVLRGTGYEVGEVERLWVPISRCTGGAWGVVGWNPGFWAGTVDNWEGCTWHESLTISGFFRRVTRRRASSQHVLSVSNVRKAKTEDASVWGEEEMAVTRGL